MDARNNVVEKCSLNLKRTFSNIFDWDKMDVSYVKVDLIDKCIFVMPSNYDWHLTYFDSDLDLNISERIVPGIQFWNHYSSKHTETLLRNSKREAKVDICTQYGRVFEILSINSKRKLSLPNIMTLYKWKPIVAFYAQNVWSQTQDNILPLREEISSNQHLMKDADGHFNESLNSDPYMRFGDVNFTRKEIITIRLLLSHKKVKEISSIQRCSVTSEKARIQRIKEKLNYGPNSLGGLFNALKEHGISLSCLEELTVYP